MYKFKTINHKKVVLCLLTFVLSIVSASMKNRYNKVRSFTCTSLDRDCQSKNLTLERYSCDVKIDYDKEESKLSGRCEFYVDNASKYCTGYKFIVHVAFKDNASKTIFAESSYPYYIKPGASERVTFIVPRQDWDSSRMISFISPKIQILGQEAICPNFFCFCFF